MNQETSLPNSDKESEKPSSDEPYPMFIDLKEPLWYKIFIKICRII